MMKFLLSEKKHLTVSVVIPCLNCAKTISNLISSLRQQALPGGVEMQIIVVDNGSTDETLRLLSKLPACIIQENRRGPAAARNTGIQTARGEIIIFLDADTRPADSEFILQHLKTLSLSEEIGIAGGAISPDPEQKGLIAFADNAACYFNWHNGLAAKFFSFQPTANLAFRRELIDKVGLLREELLWLEDFEWQTRVRKKGYKIYFNPKAAVYHRGRESLLEALRHLYTWGLNVRRAYLPGRPEQCWLWKKHRCLFCTNVPFRILLQTYIVIKRWIRVCPMKTLLLTPLYILLWSAWGIGIIVGTYRYPSRLEEQNYKNRKI